MRDYKIPKNINQQDTIGNFTFPQLGIMGGGILLVLVLFGSGMNLIVAFILSLPVAFLTYVLMYVKKMEMPIYEYALVYLAYKATPKLMIYRKENKRELLSIEEQIFIIEEEEMEKEEIEKVKKLTRKEKVEKKRLEKEQFMNAKKEKELNKKPQSVNKTNKNKTMEKKEIKKTDTNTKKSSSNQMSHLKANQINQKEKDETLRDKEFKL